MKDSLKVALCTGILTLGLVSTAFGMAVGFNPNAQVVNLGDTARVDILFSDPAGSLVGAYDISVDYDNTILDLIDVTFGGSLGGPADSLQDFSTALGRVTVAESSFLFDLSALQDGLTDVPLFTLVFDTLVAGTSALTITDDLVSDDFGFELAIERQTGAINVLVVSPPVPMDEPSIVVLTGLGLAVLWRRRSIKVTIKKEDA